MESKKPIPLVAVTFGLSLGAAAAAFYSSTEAEACALDGGCFTCSSCSDGVLGPTCVLCNLDNYSCYIDGPVRLCY
jgi:hypothetical protein